ncbi:hypothetical protein PVX_121860 [Plasmodium vivax]|uniref:Uncharacterized protein n=1 Tax=Plasmodium vivax (strain Salvador I) TaxID=126793 RepID=A5JYZ6_PLAVS|nr:hypothetical protein PVX_121860 [Plasmodium vivax]EDL47207.1 hypothetical protein PVX_121860 [Plasmodium vivax]|eukprot:XP_001616934.1 hypothetical protein [Plasmodium vivax Sal-1]
MNKKLRYMLSLIVFESSFRKIKLIFEKICTVLLQSYPIIVLINVIYDTDTNSISLLYDYIFCLFFSKKLLKLFNISQKLVLTLGSL